MTKIRTALAAAIMTLATSAGPGGLIVVPAQAGIIQQLRLTDARKENEMTKIVQHSQRQL